MATRVAPTEVPAAERVRHANLAAALAAFQSEIPSVVKGATATVQTKAGGQYQYQYADLAVITPLVLPLLGKNGLAWITLPKLVGQDFVLHYMLAHESGETIEGEYPLPASTLPAQELGTAITYARRYALCSVTGVAPGGDDDDASTNPSAPARRAQARKAPEPTPQAPVFATTNWAAEIVDAANIDDLRSVHQKAVAAGELGLVLDPKFETHLVGLTEQWGLNKPNGATTAGMAIQAVKQAMEAALNAAAEADEENVPAPSEGPEPVQEWETATPGGDPA